jgi:hypothetical protein
MPITINTVERIVSGHWRVNVTDNDGETHLIKLPRSEQPPRPADVREVVRALEDRRTERRRLAAEERARLLVLTQRVRDFRRGALSNAETRALLGDLLGDLRDELRG